MISMYAKSIYKYKSTKTEQKKFVSTTKINEQLKIKSCNSYDSATVRAVDSFVAHC